jgi:hypothetical protein
MRRALVAAAAAASLLAGSGCGGGAPSSSFASNAVTPQAAQGTLTVKIPTKTSLSSSVREPKYVSPDTASVSFEVSTSGGNSYGPPQYVTIDLTNSTVCPIVDGSYACSAHFTAPVGVVWLRIKAWSGAAGTGSVLSQAVVPNQTILANSSNDISVTLDGVASTLLLVLRPSTVAAGTASSFSAVVEGKDAAGNIIVVPPGNLADSDGNPLAPTLSAGTHASAFSIGTYDASSDTFVVTYTGDSSIVGPIVFTAAASGYASATASLTVTPLPGLSVTPTSLQFLDLSPQAIAIAETGYGSGTFAATPSSGCAGVITVPAAASAADGTASLTITPIAAGGTSPLCTVTITDSYGQSQSVTVTVTRTHGTIQ